MFERSLSVRSNDGTEVVAAVVGEGPPLLFLPAGPGTSEASWRHVVPHLAERFMCCMVDTRGRGLSGQSDDHRPTRLCEDIVSFARSLGPPVGIVEWGSDLWGRVAAAASDAVAGVAVFDTGVHMVMDPAVAPRFEEVIGGVAERSSQGMLSEAAEFLIERSRLIYSDEDYDDDAAPGFWREAVPNIPVFVQQLMPAGESPKGGSTDPDVLRGLEVPVLLMWGERSNAWFADSTAYLAGHLPHATVREIDAAHFAPYLAPEAVAEEIDRFFEYMRARD